MMNGFDIELVSRVEKIVNVPIVVSGGGGEPKHFRNYLQKLIPKLSPLQVFSILRGLHHGILS